MSSVCAIICTCTYTVCPATLRMGGFGRLGREWVNY